MAEHAVGSLVITDPADGSMVGIITDRDLVKMLAEGRDPDADTVSCFVGAPLETVSVNDTLRDVTERMRKHAVRRFPIVDVEGRLVGIVSLDDVLVLLGREMSDVASAVETELERERIIEEIRTGSTGSG
jgi:CBS domain-containing protein